LLHEELKEGKEWTELHVNYGSKFETSFTDFIDGIYGGSIFLNSIAFQSKFVNQAWFFKDFPPPTVPSLFSGSFYNKSSKKSLSYGLKESGNFGLENRIF